MKNKIDTAMAEVNALLNEFKFYSETELQLKSGILKILERNFKKAPPSNTERIENLADEDFPYWEEVG